MYQKYPIARLKNYYQHMYTVKIIYNNIYTHSRFKANGETEHQIEK